MSFSVRMLVLVAFSGLAYGLGAVFSPVAAAQDVTAPRVDSVSASLYSNEDSQQIQLGFNEAVVNIDAGDFTVVGSTATITGFSNPFGNTYRFVISGGDLADIADTDLSLGLAGGQDITDAAGNALTTIVSLDGWTHVNVNNTPPAPAFTSAAVAPVSQPFTVDLDFTPQNGGFEDSILTFGFDSSILEVGNGTIESFTPVNGAGGIVTGATIQVRPLDDGPVTLDLPADTVRDESSNLNTAATQFSINADVDVPTINIFKPGAPCPCDGPITVTMSFSEGGITGFDISDLVVTGGTLSNFSYVNSGSVTLTPSADGTMTLQIPAGSMTDPDGFGNLESNLFSAEFDTTRPTVTLTTAAAAPVTDEFDLDITFSEPMTNIGNTGAWTVTNGSRLSVTGSGANYVMRVRPQQGGQGTLTLDLDENGFSDAAGNGVVAPAQFSIAFDRANPRIASIERFSPAQATTNADSLIFTVTFSEDVSNVDAADFDIYTADYTLANTTATITDVTAVSASVYRVTVSGGNLDSLNNTTITLNGRTGGNILDAAGNVMSVRSPQTTPEAYTMDNAAPTILAIERMTPFGEQTNADSLTFIVNFSEEATNVDTADFAVNGTTTATVTGVSASAGVADNRHPGIDGLASSPSSHAYEVTVSGGDLASFDGVVGLDLAAVPTITDSVGNSVPTGEPATDQTYDVRNTAPLLASITRMTPTDAVTNADSLTWRFTFSQIDHAFDLPASAFTVSGTNASVTDVTRFSIGFDVTVSGGSPDQGIENLNGDVTIGLANTDFTDDYGNVMDRTIPAGAELTYTLDNDVPTVAITSASGTLVNGDFELTITFSEPVTGFDENDLVRSNSGYYGFSGSGTTYTVTAAPGGDPFTFDIPAGAAQDSAGNDNTAATQFVGALDTSRPTVTAQTTGTTTVNSSLYSSGPFTVNFTFSEPVVDFVIGDIQIQNGTASNLTGSDADWSVTITPTANSQVELTLPTASFADAAGNDGFGVDLMVDDDQINPRVFNLQRLTPTDAETSADVLVWEFRTDENTTNVDAGDFVLDGTTATITNVTSDAGGHIYEITAAGGDLADLNGDVTLSLASGQDISDFAGNPITDTTPFGTHTPTFTVDNTAPVLTAFARNTPATEQTDADSLVFAITFDEAVSSVTADDFTISGTTATGVLAGSGASYTLTLSGGDLADLNGVVGLNVAGGQDITDQAGNALAGAEPATDHSYDVLNDAIAPRVTSIERNTPSTELTNEDNLTWAVRFSENVTAIDAADFVVSGTTGSVTNVSPLAVALPPSVAGDGISTPFAVSSSAYLVTASGGDLAAYSGVVTLSFAGTQNIADEAENLLANTTPTGANEASFTLDNTAPTLELETTATAPVSAAFAVTATFSEDVTGFDASDLAVSNGTVSGFQAVSATIYTVSITPGPGPAVTLDVTAGAAVDAAGNGNIAASQLSINHDPDRTLTVILPGVGSGSVTSAPAGINCGTDCSEDVALGTSVTLTATADTGSSFAGWTTGPCTGTSTATCAVTINADTSVAARFTLDTPPAGRIVAATLPGARSGYVGGPVITAFLSVVSRTSSPAQSCQIAAPAGAPVTLTYRELDGAGVPIGPDSPVFDIDAGGTLSFILAMTATSQTGPTGYSFLPVITCENASLDPIVGVNDVLLNIGATPTPDLLAVNATPSGDGVIRISAPGRVQFMTVSVINIGIGDGSGAANEVTLTTTVDTGAAVLPLSLDICQINASAVCITPRGSSVTSTMTGSDPLFFAVFVRDTSTGGIAFDPANSRVFLRFADASGTIRSSTSAAVTAPAPSAGPEIASSLPQGRWSVLMRQPQGVWPGLARASLYVMADGRVMIDDGVEPRLTTIAAVTEHGETDGHFAANGSNGLWTTDGTIRLGGPWAEQTGEFWGVRDTRSDTDTHWSDLAGTFGETLFVSESGEIRGTIGGCGVYGEANGLASRAVTLSLSGCAQSGSYLGQMDMPANDTDAPALLIANGANGWRVER